MLFLLLFKYLFMYLAVPGLSCSMWNLVPWPAIKPRPSALGARSLSHWTSREVPVLFLRKFLQMVRRRGQNLPLNVSVPSMGLKLINMWCFVHLLTLPDEQFSGWHIPFVQGNIVLRKWYYQQVTISRQVRSMDKRWLVQTHLFNKGNF